MLHEYKCRVIRVVDGDTVDVNIDLGFDIWVKKRVRLLDIDTPEVRTRDEVEKFFGIKAKNRLEELLGEEAYVITVIEKDKFGRVLGTFLDKTYANINTILVQERLAVEYYGQSKDDIQERHQQNFEHHMSLMEDEDGISL